MTRHEAVRRVAVVAKHTSREAIRTAHELAGWLEERGLETAVDADAARASATEGQATYRPEEAYDLVVVLGGDGTFLSVARAARPGTPILGVNLGRLGFLSELSASELYGALDGILEGRFAIEERSMMDVELVRRGKSEGRYRVLNDAVIAKSALARIIDITLRIDDRLVATYRADGLIVSTPTGSTAYNLSAGGPIVDPSLPVVLITPICPHTFSQRPVVAANTARIRLTLETPREEVYLTLDGQEGTNLAYRDTVDVTLSDQRVHLARVGDRTFYDSLRGKLHWGE